MMKILHIHLFKNAGTSLINFRNKLQKLLSDLEHELGKFNVFVEKDELMQCAEKYLKNCILLLIILSQFLIVNS